MLVCPELSEWSMYPCTLNPITVEDSEYKALHTVVQTTHEDHSLDQAAAALVPLMFERQRVDIASVRRYDREGDADACISTFGGVLIV